MNFRMVSDILFRELVQGQRAHGQPDNLITIELGIDDEVVVALVQIGLVVEIAVQAAQVIFRQRAIDVADQQLVRLMVEVNL